MAKEIVPRYVFLENVPAICTKGGWDVVSSLAEVGYDCRWCVISAASVGACHRRERWFCLAKHTDSIYKNTQQKVQGESLADSDGIDTGRSIPGKLGQQMRIVANANGKRLERQRNGACGISKKESMLTGESWRETVSNVRRTTDGVQFRVDRIKSLGNAVVPIQAKTAFETLMGLK